MSWLQEIPNAWLIAAAVAALLASNWATVAAVASRLAGPGANAVTPGADPASPVATDRAEIMLDLLANGAPLDLVRLVLDQRLTADQAKAVCNYVESQRGQ